MSFSNPLRYLLVLALLLSQGGRAWAFDTGHHFDLTREVLAEFGMNETATEICVVENWLVDYYSSRPGTDMKEHLAKLHFDNLFTTPEVTYYWDRLTANSKTAFEQAAREDDPLKVLCLLGMSLHTVQDFYTHSNWVETHPATAGADYNTETWFDTQKRDSLHTGRYDRFGTQEAHGDYTSGMNHDSYVRPRWDAAYVFAYAASRQWVSNVARWVTAANPTLWQRIQKTTLSVKDRKGLDGDMDALLRVSEWVSVTEDGHYKGKGSGNFSRFKRILSVWGSTDSTFVEHFTKRSWYRLLTGGVSGIEDLAVSKPALTTVPKLAHLPITKKAVVVRTLSVEQDEGTLLARKNASLGTPSFYALMMVDGQLFTEAAQSEKAAIKPSWTTIKFVEASKATVALRYMIMDERGSINGATDEPCDINPGPDAHLDLTLTLATHALAGSILGVHDSDASAWTSQGESISKAKVRLYITVRTLANP